MYTALNIAVVVICHWYFVAIDCLTGCNFADKERVCFDIDRIGNFGFDKPHRIIKNNRNTGYAGPVVNLLEFIYISAGPETKSAYEFQRRIFGKNRHNENLAPGNILMSQILFANANSYRWRLRRHLENSVDNAAIEFAVGF
jgi:hypothetical protein